MLLTTLRNAARPALRQSNRTAALALTSIRTMSEGATGSGASRPGGSASGDAYTKREKANEDYYVKQKEKERLLAMRKKLNEQRAHLDELDKHIEELTKEQGGEHN